MSKSDGLLEAYLVGSVVGRQVADSYDYIEKLKDKSAQQQRLTEEKSAKKIVEEDNDQLKSILSTKNKEIHNLHLSELSLRTENEKLKETLKQPLDEIALKDPDFANNLATFKETYFDIISEWVVAQKAFRELALKYGTKMGKTQEEISEEAKLEAEKVKLNQTQFGNNLKN